jgi:hypothetical protein
MPSHPGGGPENNMRELHALRWSGNRCEVYRCCGSWGRQEICPSASHGGRMMAGLYQLIGFLAFWYFIAWAIS